MIGTLASFEARRTISGAESSSWGLVPWSPGPCRQEKSRTRWQLDAHSGHAHQTALAGRREDPAYCVGAGRLRWISSRGSAQSLGAPQHYAQLWKPKPPRFAATGGAAVGREAMAEVVALPPNVLYSAAELLEDRRVPQTPCKKLLHHDPRDAIPLYAFVRFSRPGCHPAETALQHPDAAPHLEQIREGVNRVETGWIESTGPKLVYAVPRGAERSAWRPCSKAAILVTEFTTVSGILLTTTLVRFDYVDRRPAVGRRVRGHAATVQGLDPPRKASALLKALNSQESIVCGAGGSLHFPRADGRRQQS
ncbi:hypothetical protein VTN00DRAFT_4365 [Thermoascus crustaceus]|uniref:uncharacterized protein n=1 Tax=Thermoascus crustaceus TaxID=5088 RepID=UPI0037430F5C